MSPPTSSSSSLAEALYGWPPPVLDPAGPFSHSVTTLSWVLIGLVTLIFIGVCAAMWVALYGSDALRAKLGGERVVKWFGLIIPAGVLLVLLVWGLLMVRGLSTIQGDELRLRVSGNLYWWRVSYLDAEGREIHADANELHIPAGRPVVVEMVSEDVIHSFWVPRLGGKMDMIPGRTNRLKLQADEPGSYGGQCAEFCGGAHALMGFVVIAHEEADWQRWMQQRLQPPPTQSSVEALHGQRLFNELGCATCHRVAGTDAQGTAGPDLTHIASRQSLGAGILPNTRATLIGWIADSQSIKPNNRMPAYRSLTADELNALASYLETLK
ncbi:MAG: cytochrome c oxidase subunit II [Hydrogenophaga sp.]|uniref:cytochrome c oxidase subunit II n=1 Tax=Hydrogenophaga sp. TaxID=1904254 RepID=UPI001696FE63|nr:cytochrome c oxidase subunit II [Hydrogenophaga sp.]NIM40132.1 cytochrome c oxidase subunit II [Hydrogenophaga sp.]NIN25366.1 cytochrome c oxidase subunit II [Hydrogenophaga sp.]NIN32223.1 cytochrome c oxidase subunit II [Hydrogenophaga sp.]NIN56472.1 cytochrome c oxidase subunit II [Hydrogenophaga sp.]NIO52781.1 cytochrome c oxidase subunit II [Hydrogenophaga sp.]